MDKIEMLNYLYHDDKEFCHHLWLNGPDSITSRLLGMVEELVRWKEVGEDPDEVEDKLQSQKNEIDSLYEEIGSLQHKVDELEKRTVHDMVHALDREMNSLKMEARRAREDARRSAESEEQMKSKLEMWAILNR